MPTEQFFTLPQIAAIASAEYRTLHNWVKRGLLVPSKHQAHGAGDSSIFTEADALEACVLADLRRAGFGMDILDRMAAEVRGLDNRLVGNELLLLNGRFAVLHRPEDLLDALASGTPAVVYDVSSARDIMNTARALTNL